MFLVSCWETAPGVSISGLSVVIISFDFRMQIRERKQTHP